MGSQRRGDQLTMVRLSSTVDVDMEVPLQDDHQVKLAELGWTTEDFEGHEDVFFDSLI